MSDEMKPADEPPQVTVVFTQPIVQPGTPAAQARGCLCSFERNMQAGFLSAERGDTDHVMVVIHDDCPLHKIVGTPMDDTLGPVRPPPPTGLNRWRWRVVLLRTGNHPVRFLYWPPRSPTDHRIIRMYDQQGYDFGILDWRICNACRIGSIQKISITDDFHRRGLGRQMLLHALGDSPDYTWRTSGQSPDGQRFFAAMTAETGIPFPAHGRSCEHLNPPGPSPIPVSTLRRSRPTVLHLTKEHR